MAKHHRVGGPRAQGFAKLSARERREAARSGGKALVEARGVAHLREIGSRGGQARSSKPTPDNT